MAYLNISEWSSDQVTKWLRGLDNVLVDYIPLFLRNDINGHKLLSLRCDDLETLGIFVIGHQELLLEAVERLRKFHYEVSRENVQQLALRVASAANSLRREVQTQVQTLDLPTRVLADVANLMAVVKPLVCWLDRSPFTEQADYCKRKSELLKLSFEASTYAQRGRFSESPSAAIDSRAKDLAKTADFIVQGISDPMILQPSTLETVCIKKKDNQLGFDIVPSFGGYYQVANIKFGSPAHASGKIEEGDEIVQANYHTVIGWSLETVIETCLSPIEEELSQNSKVQVSSPDCLVLTLRRRPATRSTALTTPQLRPFRPIRRPWAELNGHLVSNNCNVENKESKEKERSNENWKTEEIATGDSSSDESDLLSPPASPIHPTNRLYPPKPKSLVQRRNTISGSSPISKRPNVSIEQFWQELKTHKNFKHTGSAQMQRTDDDNELFNNLYRRDKAQSCSTGLEISPRPKTYLGVGLNHSLIKNEKEEQENEISKSRGKLDKCHSTPAYDFDNNNENPGPLVTQIIPESPTTPTESPTIVIHSAEKADQILDFKKSSSQIGKAIKQQTKHREEVKFDFTTKKTTTNQVKEAINIAMMEQQKNDKKTFTKNSKYETQTTNIETGEILTKTLLVNEQVHQIQNEIVEAINNRKLITSVKRADEPPVPPPRPPSTQKPSYVQRDYVVPVKDNRLPDFPPLKPEKPPESQIDYHYLKTVKNLDISQITPPIQKHIRKQDIQVIPNAPLDTQDKNFINISTSVRDMDPKLSPRLNKPEILNQSNLDLSKGSDVTLSPTRSPLIINSPAKSDSSKTLSPTNSVVRGIFPSAKSKSLKKKNSILAKRRKVYVKDLSHSDLQGMLFQRCRTKTKCIVWDQKWCVLVANTLYGFKNKDAHKADCLIFLNGFTVSPAQEIKSKPFAFKVYHTGTVFYFSAETEELMNTWYDYISKATMLNYDSWERAHKKEKKVDESKHFSETDYSDEDFNSDKDVNEATKDVKEKDKSKFGSLKKLTNRKPKTDSSENVSHSSTSLDRKYLKIFSSRYGKHKEDKKHKNTDMPKPTDQIFRKKSSSSQATVALESSNSAINIHEAINESNEQNLNIPNMLDVLSANNNSDKDKLPKHMNYIHASNPNLLHFENNDFHSRSNLNSAAPKSNNQMPDNFLGFVTLKEFMLKKQEEERREVYSNTVLLGIEKVKNDEKSAKKAKDLQKQLEKIVPDVIYGELPATIEESPTLLKEIQNRSLPKTPEKPIEVAKSKHDYTVIPEAIKAEGQLMLNCKPISVKGKDGYEKIVYPSNASTPEHSTKENKKMEIVDKPPDILPRKPVRDLRPSERKDSLSSAKDLGYETIYGDDPLTMQNESSGTDSKHPSFSVSTVSGNEYSTSRSSISSNDEFRLPLKMTDDTKKPLPPPKIMPKSKQVLNRQSSLTANANRNSGPDLNPVFVQGESPEKFWLNSLRRNDKVHQGKNEILKSEKFFTKRSEPSALMKSSEATIVKSDKVNKNYERISGKNDEKVLKNATQYKPLALPIVSAGTSLKTSTQFEMTLDAKEPVPTGISRLRQIFQNSGGSGQTSLSSPKAKRSMFRKQSSQQPTEDWSHGLTYTKMDPAPPQEPEIEPCDGIVTMRNLNIPDYPNMEYPPTFEPEVYSLADPSASLQLLRKKRND